MIAPNIGLLKIVYFPGELGVRFSEALDAAIDALKEQGCERLIIDLRGNIGGGIRSRTRQSRNRTLKLQGSTLAAVAMVCRVSNLAWQGQAATKMLDRQRVSTSKE